MNMSFGRRRGNANGGFDFEKVSIYKKLPHKLKNFRSKLKISVNAGLSVFVHVIDVAGNDLKAVSDLTLYDLTGIVS